MSSSNLPTRRVSKRAAALRAVDKVKADLEQFSLWEAKEKEVEDFKHSAAVSNDDCKQVAEAPVLFENSVQPAGVADYDDFDEAIDDLFDDGDDESSLHSIVDLSSTCPSATDESDESDSETSTDGDPDEIHPAPIGSNDAVTMTDSEMKRWEYLIDKQRKANARLQHSGRDMFLSRRLSRKIRYTRRDEGRSPTLSPIMATTLMFSPELTPHARKRMMKKRKQVQMKKNETKTKHASRDMNPTEAFC